MREHPYRRRVDLLEHGVAMNASELAGKDAELAAVRERIDEAYGKIGAVIADIQRAVVGLSARVAALENPNEITSRQAELEATVESMVEALSAFATRMETVERDESSRSDLLDSLLARVSELNDARESDRANVRESLEHLAVEIGEKLAAERNRYIAEADLSRVLDTWASDRSSLEARFEDVERRLARTDELDDLSRRLDAVEHGPHGVFSPVDGPVPGDGRFRLELRALELRLEQAESAAFEGRDAVLAQLARMRSRVEPSPLHDEADGDDPVLENPLPAGAEVVPFRGAEV